MVGLRHIVIIAGLFLAPLFGCTSLLMNAAADRSEKVGGFDYEWACEPLGDTDPSPMRCRFWATEGAGSVCSEVQVVCGKKVHSRRVCTRRLGEKKIDLRHFYPPIEDSSSCNRIRLRRGKASCRGWVGEYHDQSSDFQRQLLLHSMPKRCKKLASRSSPPALCDDYFRAWWTAQSKAARVALEESAEPHCVSTLAQILEQKKQDEKAQRAAAEELEKKRQDWLREEREAAAAKKAREDAIRAKQAKRDAICRAWMKKLAAAQSKSEKRRIARQFPSECND